jgi:hypothetical protein
MEFLHFPLYSPLLFLIFFLKLCRPLSPPPLLRGWAYFPKHTSAKTSRTKWKGNEKKGRYQGVGKRRGMGREWVGVTGGHSVWYCYPWWMILDWAWYRNLRHHTKEDGVRQYIGYQTKLFIYFRYLTSKSNYCMSIRLITIGLQLSECPYPCQYLVPMSMTMSVSVSHVHANELKYGHRHRHGHGYGYGHWQTWTRTRT